MDRRGCLLEGGLGDCLLEGGLGGCLLEGGLGGCLLEGGLGAVCETVNLSTKPSPPHDAMAS